MTKPQYETDCGGKRYKPENDEKVTEQIEEETKYASAIFDRCPGDRVTYTAPFDRHTEERAHGPPKQGVNQSHIRNGPQHQKQDAGHNDSELIRADGPAA